MLGHFPRLESARLPASRSELLTPIVLLGLFGYLASIYPFTENPYQTYECETRSLTHGALGGGGVCSATRGGRTGRDCNQRLLALVA